MHIHSNDWKASARAALKAASIAAALLLGCATGAEAATSWVSTATQGVTLGNFLVPATSVGPLPSSTPLTILVGLQLQNASKLDSAILAVNTPGNPSYGKFLKPAEFASTYAPTAAQVQAVRSYLSSMGLAGFVVPSNRMYITASGTAAQINKAFNTTLWQYQVSGPNGEPTRTVFANTQPAQVPASLGGIVLSVVGLQNIDTMHTFLGTWPTGVQAGPTAPTTPANPVTFTPQDFWNVYNVGPVPAATSTTIAIFAEGNLAGILPDPSNPSSPNDLRQFEQENTLPQVPVSIVQVGLGSTDTSGAIEFDMDTQESTGMAGNVNQLVVYDVDSLYDVNLIPGFNTFVVQDVAQAGSASFGGCEAIEYASGAMPLYDQIFRQAAVQGQTVFASAGDSGSACGVNGDLNGVPLSGVPATVEFPAADTYVVGAGGTTILVDSNFNVIQTTAWDAGGGGFSLFEPAGAWQFNFVPAETGLQIATPNGAKGVPDVAMDADFLLSPAGFVSGGGDTTNGGTSLASPLSLGSWARIQSAHNNTLGFAAPGLYAMSTPGLPTSTIGGMTDITVGSNGAYAATAGWDFTTGLGSFNVAQVTSMIGQSSSTAATSPCALPGTLVLSQPAGNQTGAPANAEDDVLTVNFAEPYSASNPAETLTVTMTVANLGALPALPPNTFWKVYFSFQNQVYFVDMDTVVPGGTPAAPEFEYGVTTPNGTGGNADTSLGAITGTYSVTNNTITWQLPASLVIPPTGTFPNVTPGTSGTPPSAGSQLAAVHGSTQLLAGADAGLLETIDSTPNGAYTMVGNAACNPAAPVVAALAATPSSGQTPLTVTLDASASHPPLNGGTITEYTFSPGDGTGEVQRTLPTWQHTYSKTGVFKAEVIVSDSSGGTGTSPAVKIDVVAPSTPPTAALTANPESGTTPLTVKFNASGSSDPNSGGAIKQYAFNFGDGTAQVVQRSSVVSHQYTTAGSYIATVIVTDKEGGTASTSVTVNSN
ncbi:MAG TPA: protease pro-enzyme activation domain-containing protein [Steroidobacteraceae bacterium]